MSEPRPRPPHRPTKAMAVGFAVVAVGALLAVQGWRAREANVDVIRYVDAARQLVQHGSVPDRGNATSYQAYAPPGTAWLMVPGVVMFSDMRLYELPGGLVLYIGALVGVFLLGRVSFGTSGALLALSLYALSSHALFLASSLWPLGHPCFFVWMSYFAQRWATRRLPRYLVAAVATWCVGMYVHMGLAPAILMLPAVWWVYRPPMAWRTLALVGAASALLWFPYLRFEMSRGFIDLRAQVLREALQPADKYGWCDPSLAVAEWTAPPASTSTPVVDFTEQMAANVTANFAGVVPASGVVLLAITLSGLVCFSVAQSRPRPIGGGPTMSADSRGTGPWIAGAGAMLLAAVATNEWVVARFLSVDGVLTSQTVWTIRAWQAAMVLGAVVILGRQRIGRAILGLGLGFEFPANDLRPLLLALGVPWAVLLIVAEPGVEHRFVFLWPLQLIVLAGFCASIKARSRRAVWCRRGAGLAIAALVILNPVVVERVDSWRHAGLAGTESPMIQAADYLAGVLRANRRTEAAIGYRLFDSALPDVPYPGADRRGKIGGVFDAVLEYREGITNTDRCAEGVSNRDEYRVVQIAPPSDREVVYVEFPPGPAATLLRRVGDLDVQKLE